MCCVPQPPESVPLEHDIFGLMRCVPQPPESVPLASVFTLKAFTRSVHSAFYSSPSRAYTSPPLLLQLCTLITSVTVLAT